MMEVYTTNGGVSTYEIELHGKLLEKVVKEYNEFEKKILKEKPEIIFKKAYEIVCKEEICCLFEKNFFDVSMIKTLLKQKNILDECYRDWLKADGNFYETLEYSVYNSINKIVESPCRILQNIERE